uniref:UPAR/Ly6 domain-containing protein qvr n=1 Tax=Syphacia muris TaxID=451379 RepID=A0A0N5AKK8_9BILA
MKEEHFLNTEEKEYIKIVGVLFAIFSSVKKLYSASSNISVAKEEKNSSCLEWDYSQWKSAWKNFDWKTQLLFSTEDEETKCYSCTSIDASEIVNGAGIHPGVYLTSVLLSSLPVTNECYKPDRLASLPICDDGLCVKINYTSKLTGKMDILRACLPRSKGVFKQTCTDFVSSQAAGTWCVCSGNKCNSSPAMFTTTTILLSITVPVLLLTVFFSID